MENRETTQKQNFWAKVDKQGPNDCWLWIGAVATGGYGSYDVIVGGKRYKKAHRYSYALHNGWVLGSESVHHTCSVRLCVNPSHLQKITQRENMAEMLERKYYKKRIKELEEELRKHQDFCSC